MTGISRTSAILWSLTLLLLLSNLNRANHSEAAGPQRAAAGASWRFAVSGDSRNCGDVVMPAIAAGARSNDAAFFWHLGDFRFIYQIDQDFADDPNKTKVRSEYEKLAWKDFIDNQLRPFGDMPVFLAIGNHELNPPSLTRENYKETFKNWLTASDIAREPAPNGYAIPDTYFHWIRSGIDFITLDNASYDQFDPAQMAWFENVLQQDESNSSISTIVVGMHRALPDSISWGHSMSESGNALTIESGRQAYRDLLKAQNEFHKKVYVLASHSHYYMSGIFNTPDWLGNVLPGWIVGTAGAERYQLPEGWRSADQAQQGVYGYLIATVNPDTENGREPDGSIRFEFHLINRSDLPEAVRTKFSRRLIDFCFDQNMQRPN